MLDKNTLALVLAPMAGITDRPFRTLAHRYGATLSVSEMISAKAIHYGDKKTATLASLGGEGAVAVQIFGSEPSIMAEAAYRLATGDYVGVAEGAKKPCMIDINMGCPMRKIVSNGDGSALMKDPKKIFEIVSAVTKGCPLPVSVKMRVGWDDEHKNAPECAKAACEGGAAMIAVHGRTREQLYAPPIDYETIAAVKAAVSVPVIGNGGICDGESARRMLETGVDGLMIGQGAIGRPWIFKQLSGGDLSEPTDAQKIEVAKEHIRLLAAEKGEWAAVREGRRHLMYYVKGMRGAAEFRMKICSTETVCDIYDELDRLLEGTSDDRI